MHGYHGRYLQVTLPDGHAGVHPLLPEEARRFVGGSGLATWWLLRHNPAAVEPLSADNALVLASCPLVDTGFTTTAKAAFAARSPQTGFLGESLLSSRFAIQFKRTGFDGLVVLGGCETLSALIVDEDEVRVLPVPELAGRSASEAEHHLREVLGREYQVAAIGAAGERQVRYATISHNGRHAGRTGLGAVMGAKGLKAIAVRGSRRTSIADPGSLDELVAEFRQRSLGPDTAKYRLLGTAGNMLSFERLGILPSRNFTQSQFPQAERLTGEGMAESRTRERSGCAACTVGCEHRFVPAGGDRGVRAEYESLFALGPLLGIGDPDQVLRAAALCDEFGLDTLSLGGTLAWAMECAERGLVHPALAGEPGLRYGDADAVLDAIPLIAERAGIFGDLLAEGSRLAARHVGQGSASWAMHVKGLELPGYEPRALKTLALGLAVGARGACHNRSSGYDADLRSGRDPGLDFAVEAARAEDQAAVLDALVICKFLRKCFSDFYSESADLLNVVTGWDISGGELRAAGGRIVTLKRLYNQREGASRADDTLPDRLLREPVAEGPAAGAALSPEQLAALLTGYYQTRGWTPDGRVPEELADWLLEGLAA